MPQPVAFNTGSAVSGSIQTSKISYAVDGQDRDYRGGYAGKTWYSELPATNGVVFAKDTTSLGRGVSGSMAFWTSATTSSTDVLFTANRLPDSPGNFSTTQSAYSWSLANGWFLNNPNEPFNNIDADGLVLYLDAGKISSYPETASKWYDISGNNYSGSLINGPSFNPNGAIVLDGIDDYVSQNFYTATNFTENQSWTIDTLINVVSSESAGNTRGGVLTNQKYQSETNPGGFGLNIIAQTYCINLTSGSTGNAISYQQIASIPINYNKIERITALWDSGSSTAKMYRNGVLINAGASTSYKWSPRSAGGAQLIGTSTQGGWGYFFPMKIYNVSLYNKALSDSEIKQNYYGGPIVTDGLVLAVDAGNLVSYESGSTLTYQLTGSVNSGSLTNGVTFLPNTGGTWDFDGTDDFINFGSSAPINFLYTNPFSTEVWMKWDGGSQPNSAGHLIGKTFTNYRSFLITDTNPGRITFRLDSNGQTTNTSNIISPNLWYHVVCTWNPTTFNAKVFVNGIERASTTNTLTDWTSTSGNFQIGNSPGENYYFNGNIAIGRVYNKTLSASEVSQNFNAQRQRFGI